ncbi:plastocyanin/azurin family copper-binding protein [Thermus antranikianii]
MRLAVLGLALVLAACFPREGVPSADLEPYAAPSREVVVSMEDFAFRPDTLRISPGTVVVFANQGQHPHTATESGGLFDSGILAPGERFRYTFALSREYSVYCKLHPYMVLRTVVGP